MPHSLVAFLLYALSSATPCPLSPPAACLVAAYTAPDFAGPSACVRDTGHLDAAALASLGLPDGVVRSLRIAPGYDARLATAAAPDDRDADLVLRGDVPRLYSAGGAGWGAFDHLGVHPRQHCQGRPRVFVALHGSQALARARNDHAWPEVRAHLDGIWGSDAHVAPADAAAIWRKVATRTLIQEEDYAGPGARWIPAGVYAGLQRQNPDLVLQREGLALHRADAAHWQPGDLDSLRASYIAPPQVAAHYLFGRIYTGWQPAAWTLPTDGGAPLSAAAAAAFHAGDGAFLECCAATCAGPDRRALRRLIAASHADGHPAIWYDGTTGAATGPAYLQATQSVFNDLSGAGLLEPTDAVVLINYYGRLPAVPERDADGRAAATLTGTALWLLEQ